MSSILVFGAQGQLGYRLAEQAGDDAIAITRAQCDFTALDPAQVEALITTHQPRWIINAAAYTAVDDAERQLELAYAINAEAPKILARLAAKYAVRFTHFSTDYVFDGESDAPSTETARCNPLGQYGKSKLYGEQAALDAGAQVFRLQWVYDTRGRNFFATMRRLLAERDAVKVVADQLGAPSYAPHLARAVLAAEPLAPGLYHLAPAGHTSWHGFACTIAQGMGINTAIAPITTAEYPTPARRPRDTRLATNKLAEAGIALPHWQDGLKEAMHATD